MSASASVASRNAAKAQPTRLRIAGSTPSSASSATNDSSLSSYCATPAFGTSGRAIAHETTARIGSRPAAGPATTRTPA